MHQHGGNRINMAHRLSERPTFIFVHKKNGFSTGTRHIKNFTQIVWSIFEGIHFDAVDKDLVSLKCRPRCGELRDGLVMTN